MKTSFPFALLLTLASSPVLRSEEIVVKVDPSENWLGFMNVFEKPENGGAFIFDSSWGPADLTAVFAETTLTLGPNTIGDPNEFWYEGGGAPGNPGKKIMEANHFVQKTGTLAGKTVTFNGTVHSNTLTNAHSAIAFIRDFSADFSSFNENFIALEPGEFSFSLETIADPTRHVQYGFQVRGPNVWITDVTPFGRVEIATEEIVPLNPNFTVDRTATWLGFMNVFKLPAPDDTGEQLFGVLDTLPPDALTATFADETLTLTPFPIDPENGLSNPDWFRDFDDGRGPRGNRLMEANLYVEHRAIGLVGQTTTFSGTVLADSLSPAHQTFAFIKEYNADYSSFTESRTLLAPGPFSLSLEISNDRTGHVQYGFQTIGPNVWMADLASFGTLVVQSVGPTLSPYESWLSSFDFSSFTDPDLSPDGDPDQDGESNRFEFASDGDPTSPIRNAKISAHRTRLNDLDTFVLTIPVLGNPEFSGAPALTAISEGIQYTISGSTNLLTFEQAVTELSPALTTNLPALTNGWNYRSFRLTAPLTTGFLRFAISEAP